MTWGPILRSSMAWGANAWLKGFNLFKPCKTPPSPSPARRRNYGPLLLAHSKYSYQLFTITSSIHVCVWPEMHEPIRKSNLITLKIRCAHGENAGRTTRCEQRERFSSQETGWLDRFVKARDGGVTWCSRDLHLVFWHHRDSCTVRSR